MFSGKIVDTVDTGDSSCLLFRASSASRHWIQFSLGRVDRFYKVLAPAREALEGVACGWDTLPSAWAPRRAPVSSGCENASALGPP
jgi:hypothetical protein